VYKNNNLQKLLKTLLSIFVVSGLLLCGPAQAGVDNVWQRVQSQLGLHALEHQRIDVERRWYQRNPDYMRRVSARAAPYLHYVVTEVEQRGMPMELALLPIMESAYDPFAYSHGRAAGLWQIIPGTGRDLGLTQDWWYDGRRDIRASTDAALNYLGELAQAFDGDWLKALAAYNAGKRRVNNAVAVNRNNGRNTDFWSLKLPTETRNYVPRLLALSQIIAEPHRYGMMLTPTADQPYFGVVDTGSQIDLVQAASLANIDIETLYQLNPGFNRWATSPQGPHELLLPIENLADFTLGFADLDPTQRVEWERYTIRSGDAMSLIARKFNTEAGLIREVNGLSGNKIRAGDTLMIPTASAALDVYALSTDVRLANKQRRADKQQRGRGTRLDYRVKAGDSFWLIARRHGVSSRQLAQWNGLAVRDPIHPGQTLVIWKPTAAAVSSPIPASREPMVKKLGYRVRDGDSLARIAGKFKIGIDEIIGWNSKLEGKKYIHPGQVLTLYVDITGS
jgi:membrane-bound lytic murein transglycosylase D